MVAGPTAQAADATLTRKGTATSHTGVGLKIPRRNGSPIGGFSPTQSHSQARKAAQARRLPIRRRTATRDQPLRGRDQRRSQTLRLDRRPQTRPRRRQAWEASVGVNPLARKKTIDAHRRCRCGSAGFYPLILLKRAPFISEVRVFEQRKACISNSAGAAVGGLPATSNGAGLHYLGNRPDGVARGVNVLLADLVSALTATTPHKNRNEGR